MGRDNIVKDNAVYFKNLTSVTERHLCFKLRKAKIITMKICMLFFLGFFKYQHTDLSEAFLN